MRPQRLSLRRRCRARSWCSMARARATARCSEVFDMALYTPRKVKALEELLACGAGAPLNFVTSATSRHGLGGVFEFEGFGRQRFGRADSPLHARQQPADRIFSGHPDCRPGETFAMEYLPGKGTTFYIEGQPRAHRWAMPSTLAWCCASGWVGASGQAARGSAAALRSQPRGRGCCWWVRPAGSGSRFRTAPWPTRAGFLLRRPTLPPATRLSSSGSAGSRRCHLGNAAALFGGGGGDFLNQVVHLLPPNFTTCSMVPPACGPALAGPGPPAPRWPGSGS